MMACILNPCMLICSYFQAIYEHLPRQRQLDDSEKIEAEGMLRMKVNKKMLQQHLSVKTGKVVTLKDITNIQTGLHTHADGNNLEAVVARLRAIDGMVLTIAFHSVLLMWCINLHYIVDVFTGDDNTFTGWLFQDASLPPTGNRQSEIVSVFITALESHNQDGTSIQNQQSQMESHQSSDVFVERAVFRKEFPQASLLICLFHTLRSFKREIT